MTSSTKPTLAFFGATGGCAANALALALKDGYSASALARTPSKLRNLLETEHQISASVLDEQLTIIQGSIKDIKPVKETLASKDKRPASIIVSGVGAAPVLQFKFPFIAMSDSHICEEGLTIILAALRELRREGTIPEEHKPLLTTISTTGLSDTRDVPYLLMPLYHILLKEAHVDKKIAERVVAEASTETGAEAPISSFVIVRPTLLMDGPARGQQAIKSGWEKHPSAPQAVSEESTKPAIGYTIRRVDVGKWIFENVIKGGKTWAGKCVSLTY